MQQSKCSIMIERDCTTLVNPITGDAKAFLLDRSYNSFDPDSESCARNDQVFEDMGPAIASSIKNEQNVTVFVMGGQGTGKTHTLVGCEADAGLIPRTLELLFAYVDNLNSGVEENYNHTTHLFGKVYDICAEKWRDLLNSKHVTGGLSLKSDALYGPYIQGLSKHKLVTLQDCESFLASVISASQSFGSAFHVIVTFDIVRVPLANPSAMRYTKVHLVRLSPSVGEASLIAQASKAPLPKDRAMTAWSSVMLALASAAPGKAAIVPSRESVMTRLLHDSMVPPCTTIVIGTLSPSHLQHKESSNTFRCLVRTKDASSVRPDPLLLRPDLAGEWVPAAGGGWRWAYYAKPGAPVTNVLTHD